MIVNTASDTDNLIAEAYRETDVIITRHTGTPPAWKSDLVFQITSGAYLPRHSLLAKDGKKLSLKKYAEDMIESFIKPSIKAGLKTLVIAPKAFQEVESVSEWAVTDPDNYKAGENAILTNHHRAEGRNDYQDCDIVFEFHYEPSHDEIQADAKHLYRNAEKTLTFTREKQTVSVNGVEFEKNVYTDTRVQAVYNRECRARLMQGAMRLRPNIHKDKIIVILTAEPIDIPVTPVPFTPRDKDKFTGDWADFKEALQAKADAIERGDVQAVMETTGQSERTAQRKTKATRDRQNTERDTQIIALHEQGKSYREIHTETGVSFGTVSNLVKAYKKRQTAIDSTNSSLAETVHPTNTDAPCVESEPLHISEPDAQTCDTAPPIPPTEYSSLDLDTARQEMERCQERMNYSGAAFLRNHIQKQERQLTATNKGASMNYYNILTIPGSELFAKIKEINTIANDDTSPEQETAIDALNNLSSLLEKRCGSQEDVLIAPGHLLTSGEMPDRDTEIR